MKKCEKCGFITEDNEINFCIKCGNKCIEISDITEKESACNYCSKCGFSNLPEASFCVKCGNSLEKPSQETDGTSQAKKKKGKIIAACLSAAVLLTAGITAGVYFAGNNKASEEAVLTNNFSESETTAVTESEQFTLTEKPTEKTEEPSVNNTSQSENNARVLIPDPDEGKLFRLGLMPASDEEGKWGYIDCTGKFVIEPQFSSARNFSQNGLAPVCNGFGVWGYIDTSGEYVIRSQFEEAYSFNGDGLAIASPKDRESHYWNDSSDKKILYGYIDETGEFVIEPKFKNVRNFSENGLAVVQEDADDNALYGYIDYSGEYVIEPQFFDAKEFASNGLAAAAVEFKKYGYINYKGEFIIEPKYVVANTFNNNGYATVAVTDFDHGGDGCYLDMYGCIDEKGNQIIDFNYGNLSSFDNYGYATYCNRGFALHSCGIIDINENIIIDCEDCYSSTIFNHGLACISNGKINYINEKGEIILTFEGSYLGAYEGTCFFNDGFAIINDFEHEQNKIIDTNGDIIINDIYFNQAETNGYIYNGGLQTYLELYYPFEDYWNYYFAYSP